MIQRIQYTYGSFIKRATLFSNSTSLGRSGAADSDSPALSHSCLGVTLSTLRRISLVAMPMFHPSIPM